MSRHLLRQHDDAVRAEPASCCSIVRLPPRVRHGVRELNVRDAWRERADDGDLRGPRPSPAGTSPSGSSRPSRPSGSSNTMGCGGMTGVLAVLSSCRRLNTDRLPSPNSKTNRDCSPSTTHAGLRRSPRPGSVFLGAASRCLDRWRRAAAACRPRPAQRTPATAAAAEHGRRRRDARAWRQPGELGTPGRHRSSRCAARPHRAVRPADRECCWRASP